MTCNGICIKYKATGPMPKGGRYLNGQKRCNRCDEYLIFNGRLCPCCKLLLRTKPRSKKYKDLLKLRTTA